jgi:hypothetical protein
MHETNGQFFLFFKTSKSKPAHAYHIQVLLASLFFYYFLTCFLELSAVFLSSKTSNTESSKTST